ncbi:MoaD/ThiS family protein [Chloroflexota bacterium]
MKCVVEMYGLALEISESGEVEIELEDRAGLEELVGELRHRIPAFEGKVIKKDENRLVENCMFNIDGRFYFDNEDTELIDGSRIRLLTLATGG